MTKTTKWVLYPIKNARKFMTQGDQPTSDTQQAVVHELEQWAKETPDMLGVSVSLPKSKSVIFLQEFMNASKVPRMVFGKEDLPGYNADELFSQNDKCLNIPFDDKDYQLLHRLENELEIEQAATKTKEERSELLYRLLWSLRTRAPMILDKNAFAIHGNSDSVSYESGEQVVVWLKGGQQLFGIVSAFGKDNSNEAVIHVTMTKKSAIDYNGQAHDFDVGSKIQAPITSVEKIQITQIA